MKAGCLNIDWRQVRVQVRRRDVRQHTWSVESGAARPMLTPPL